MRKNPNKNDLLIYNDQDYLIFKKDGEVTGSWLSALDLINIGVKHIDESLQHFTNESDVDKIIADIIKELIAKKNENN